MSLRYFNVYGERQPTTGAYCLVMGVFAQQLLNGEVMTINGDGEQKRDFIFISDVVDALVKAIGYKGANKEVFNIGSGKLTSLNQITKVIKKLFKIDVKIKYISNRQEASGWVLTNHEKIHSKLNWEPKVNLEDGLKKTYPYFQNYK